MENEGDFPEGPAPVQDHELRRPSLGARFEQWWVRNLGGEYVFLVLLSSVVGVAGGYGAILFRWLIQLVNRVAFPRGVRLGQLLSAPWYGIVSPPAIGGLLVGPLVHFSAREAKGHGVPEVMEACKSRGGRIRPRVAAVKTLASAVCIGTGGSVGREGPIVQIGSAIGSSAGQFFGLEGSNLRAMVAAGAAAGIAATFNAPIAGILFAMELFLRRGSTRTFIPLVVAAVLATVVARTHLGNSPAFLVAPYELLHPWELAIYILLGGAAALVGVGFTRGLYAIEGLWDRLPIPAYSHAVLGGAVVGVMALWFPQVMGVGYEHIEELLHWTPDHLPLGTWTGAGLLMLLVFGKVFATGTTIGSGGSGGIFAPSLFIGACLGGALGFTIGSLLPQGSIANPGAYALVAMGAVVAATTHAPLTAMVIVFELTNRISIMLPLMLSCFLSAAISMRLGRESIYTMKLVRRGAWTGIGDEEEVMSATRVSTLARPAPQVLQPETSLIEVAHQLIDGHHRHMYVVDAGSRPIGVVLMEDVAAITRDEEVLQHLLVAADMMRPLQGRAQECDSLADCLELFSKRPVVELPVVDGVGRVSGVLTRADVIAHYNREVLYRDAVLRFIDDQNPKETEAAKVSLTTGEVVAEITVEGALVGRSLRELDLRARYGVIVFAVVDREKKTRFPKADQPLERGQCIEVFGTKEQVGQVRLLAASGPNEKKG
jgi:CIC family chloride channel protein